MGKKRMMKPSTSKPRHVTLLEVKKENIEGLTTEKEEVRKTLRDAHAKADAIANGREDRGLVDKKRGGKRS